MKRILIIMLFSLMTFIGNATNFDIDIYIENDSTFLITTLKSSINEYIISQNPKIQIILKNDSIISLNGQLIRQTQTTDGGYGVTYPNVGLTMVYSKKLYISIIKFYISENQIQYISNALGFKSIRLNTIPNHYEKKYNNKGYYLYKKYKKLKLQKNKL